MIKICLMTVIMNLTNLSINEVDLRNLHRATKVCGEREGCLKVFQKREKQIYRALCGEKQGFSKKEFDKAELKMIVYELRQLGYNEALIKKKLKAIEYKEIKNE